MRFFRVFRVFRGYKKTLARLVPGNSQSSRFAPSRRVLADSPSLKKLGAIPVDRLRRLRGAPRSPARPAGPIEFRDFTQMEALESS
jgi:hypothetical protein